MQPSGTTLTVRRNACCPRSEKSDGYRSIQEASFKASPSSAWTPAPPATRLQVWKALGFFSNASPPWASRSWNHQQPSLGPSAIQLLSPALCNFNNPRSSRSWCLEAVTFAAFCCSIAQVPLIVRPRGVALSIARPLNAESSQSGRCLVMPSCLPFSPPLRNTETTNVFWGWGGNMNEQV